MENMEMLGQLEVVGNVPCLTCGRGGDGSDRRRCTKLRVRPVSTRCRAVSSGVQPARSSPPRGRTRAGADGHRGVLASVRSCPHRTNRQPGRDRWRMPGTRRRLAPAGLPVDLSRRGLIGADQQLLAGLAAGVEGS